MLNNPFRTSLTRDEIVAILLGWLDGPRILIPMEDASPKEQELVESESYCLLEDRENRLDVAYDKRIECLESGQPAEICQKPVDDFRREDEAFRRFCDEFDDEISKGDKSMLRVDRRSSTPSDICYTSLLQKSRFARDFLQREAKVEGAGGHFWHDEALTQTPQRPRNGCYPTPSDPATLECGPA